MSKIVVVGNQEFEIPEVGENAGYGSELTDFFEAIANALETVQQPNDILLVSATIANNQSSAANIPGFSFTTSEVQAIDSDFFITRSTSSPAQTFTESGRISGNYNGSEWAISIVSVGDAGVSFSITPSGQVQYTSTDISGSGYVGEIKFRAKVINNA